MSKWSEIRDNYFETETGCVYIDAWKTDDDNEEGETIAKVNVFTKEVEYLDPDAFADLYAGEVIFDVLKAYENYGLLDTKKYEVSDKEWGFISVSEKINQLQIDLSGTNKTVPSYQVLEVLTSLLLNRDDMVPGRTPAWFQNLEIPEPFSSFVDEVFIDFGTEYEEGETFNWEDKKAEIEIERETEER